MKLKRRREEDLSISINIFFKVLLTACLIIIIQSVILDMSHFIYEDFDSEEEESLEVVDADWLAAPESFDNNNNNINNNIITNTNNDLTHMRPRFRSHSNIESNNNNSTGIDIIHKSRYIIENIDLFYSLCEGCCCCCCNYSCCCYCSLLILIFTIAIIIMIMWLMLLIIS